MPVSDRQDDTDALLAAAQAGDQSARERLLNRHRDRLRRLVTVRMDDRLARRIDASDVVQDTLAEAARSLDGYLQDPVLPYYLWLRRLAWQRLVEARRKHIDAKRRTVKREQTDELAMSRHSANALVDRLVGDGTGQLSKMIRDERRQRMREFLEQLPPNDREILVLRYLEGLNTEEIATVLGISKGAVMTRHTRALQRIRVLFADEHSENDT